MGESVQPGGMRPSLGAKGVLCDHKVVGDGYWASGHGNGFQQVDPDIAVTHWRIVLAG